MSVLFRSVRLVAPLTNSRCVIGNSDSYGGAYYLHPVAVDDHDGLLSCVPAPGLGIGKATATVSVPTSKDLPTSSGDCAEDM
jgi:hypothetical protein